MGIFFRGAAMGGPSRVTDAVSAFNGRFPDHFFEVAEFSRGTANLELSVLGDDRNARGVVPAIFKFSQAFDDDRHYLFRSDVTDNSAHARALLRMLFLKTSMDLRWAGRFLAGVWRIGLMGFNVAKGRLERPAARKK